MEAFGQEQVLPDAFGREQVLPKSDIKEERVHGGKPDKEALVGELQKALPSISGTLNNYTFNFNF